MTTTTLTRERVNRLQDKANQALLDHDWPTLERLIAPGVRIVGPRGFLISRDRPKEHSHVTRPRAQLRHLTRRLRHR
jgi:hypothetical protein